MLRVSSRNTGHKDLIAQPDFVCLSKEVQLLSAQNDAQAKLLVNVLLFLAKLGDDNEELKTRLACYQTPEQQTAQHRDLHSTITGIQRDQDVMRSEHAEQIRKLRFDVEELKGSYNGPPIPNGNGHNPAELQQLQSGLYTLQRSHEDLIGKMNAAREHVGQLRDLHSNLEQLRDNHDALKTRVDGPDGLAEQFQTFRCSAPSPPQYPPAESILQECVEEKLGHLRGELQARLAGQYKDLDDKLNDFGEKFKRFENLQIASQAQTEDIAELKGRLDSLETAFSNLKFVPGGVAQLESNQVEMGRSMDAFRTRIKELEDRADEQKVQNGVLVDHEGRADEQKVQNGVLVDHEGREERYDELQSSLNQLKGNQGAIIGRLDGVEAGIMHIRELETNFKTLEDGQKVLKGKLELADVQRGLKSESRKGQLEQLALLRCELDDLQLRSRTLERQPEQLAKDLREVSSTANRLAGEYSSVKLELDQLRVDHKESESNLLVRLDQMHQTTQPTIDQMVSRQEVLEERVDELYSKMDQLRGSHEILAKKVSEPTEIQSTLDTLRDDLAETRGINAGLVSQLVQSEGKIPTFRIPEAEIQSSLSGLEDGHRQLRSELETHYRELKDRADRLQAPQEDMQSQLKGLQDSHDDVVQRLNRVEDPLSRLQKVEVRLDTLQASHDSTTLLDQLQSSQIDMTKLREELAQLQGGQQKLEGKLLDFGASELPDVQTTLKQLREEHQGLIKQLEEHATLPPDFAELQDRYKQLEGKLSALQIPDQTKELQIIQETQKDLKEKQDELITKMNNFQNLSAEFDRLRAYQKETEKAFEKPEQRQAELQLSLSKLEGNQERLASRMQEAGNLKSDVDDLRGLHETLQGHLRGQQISGQTAEQLGKLQLNFELLQRELDSLKIKRRYSKTSNP